MSITPWGQTALCARVLRYAPGGPVRSSPVRRSKQRQAATPPGAAASAEEKAAPQRRLWPKVK